LQIENLRGTYHPDEGAFTGSYRQDEKMAKIAVIVPGAGKGERFGSTEKKTLAKLDGRPVFMRSIELFINRDDVCQTILVVSGDDLKEVKQKYAANLGFMGVQLVEGGEVRRDSVAAALAVVKEEAELIAIHDAVRPCTTPQMVDDVFAEATKTGAAILACPLYGTIKRVADSRVIEETVQRTNLYEAQTPQVFRRSVITEAYAAAPSEADVDITDDAQLVELTGHPVSVVLCDPTNLKITTKRDLSLANAIMKARPAAKPARRLGAFEEAQW
jgi:2-C-methyl-D-erythritol 4-phosphate cytidylyltransferase